MGVKAPPIRQADVQFASPYGKLFIDKIADPTGRPLDVFDADVGITVGGRVELPGWLVGQGVVKLYADEIGGQTDKEIGSATFTIAGGPTPGPVMYTWMIPVDLMPLTQDKMYRFGLVFVFQTPSGGHTEIAAFYDLETFLVV
jgi:hypothetical protein